MKQSRFCEQQIAFILLQAEEVSRPKRWAARRAFRPRRTIAGGRSMAV
jgi:hypothetical protein